MRTIPSSLFPLLLTLLLQASLPPTQTSTQADEISQPGAGGLMIHVSPGGDDHWSGTLARPNAARTDGLLATLEGAHDRVRTLRHEQKIPAGPIPVVIAAGTYPLSGPVVFEPADGGTAAALVIYQAEPGTRPIFDGGRAITGFSRRPDGLWTAKVPDVAAGRWTFEQLFVNGRRATRAHAERVLSLHAQACHSRYRSGHGAVRADGEPCVHRAGGRPQALERAFARSAPRRQRIREIKEERLALPGQGGMVADELESFLGVPPGQRVLHGRLLDDHLVSHERNWRLALIGTVHVVAVRNAEIVVEPVPRRQELRMMPKMPLADAHRRIAARLEGRCQRDLAIRYSTR